MRVIMDIPIQNIKETRKPRLNLKTLRFAMSLLRGSHFPPIKVRNLRDGTWEIRDGCHRLAAHKLAGRRTVKAYVGIVQSPDPHKAAVHGPDKPLLLPKPVATLERQTWLEL